MPMPVSPLAFQLLGVCGCWRPAFCTSPCRRAMYDVFSTFTLLTLYTMTIWTITGILKIGNIDYLIESSYMLLSMIGGCCKMGNFLIYRGRIVELVDRLTEDPHKPTNAAEMLIRDKYDKIVRINTIRYAIMIETSVTSNVLNSLIMIRSSEKLPYSDWLPYDYSTKSIFYLSFTYETLSMIISSYVHVAGDALLCGLFIHMCCQIEILESRIKGIVKGQRDALRKCAWHHENIYRLAATITATFQIMIVAQFIISGLVICISVCKLLTKDILSTDFLTLMLYLSTLLTQIFLYCWYANEVKLKSAHLSEVIFASDWTDLDESLKRDLILMMRRAAYPVEFSFLHMIDVNLDSFMSLMKSSYSVYSILQHKQTQS